MKTIQPLSIHEQLGKLSVYVFNVGQGDHILIKLPNGEYGLIDFCYSANIGLIEPPVLSYFKRLKTQLSVDQFEAITIAFFCISHTDKDHVKGINESLEWFKQNQIFIRQFWLCASRDQAQLINTLQTYIASQACKLPIEKIGFSKKRVSAITESLQTFFTLFDEWKDKKFKSPRYKSETFGRGEYLNDFKKLDIPCNQVNFFNIGPLARRIVEYEENATVNSFLSVFGLDERNPYNNSLSHILKFQYGETSLLFGGDAELQIWEDCIDKYHKEKDFYTKWAGPLASQFVKVSHHGSKHSSSKVMWQYILPETTPANVCISAGRHNGYLHPNSETIGHILGDHANVNIYCTNICTKCLHFTESEKENHEWYDEYIKEKSRYPKYLPASKEPIEMVFKMTFTGKNQKVTDQQVKDQQAKDKEGLFAFVFDIINKETAEMKVRVAVTKTTKTEDACFFKTHEEKLKNCSYETG